MGGRGKTNVPFVRPQGLMSMEQLLDPSFLFERDAARWPAPSALVKTFTQDLVKQCYEPPVGYASWTEVPDFFSLPKVQDKALSTRITAPPDQQTRPAAKGFARASYSPKDAQMADPVSVPALPSDKAGMVIRGSEDSQGNENAAGEKSISEPPEPSEVQNAPNSHLKEVPGPTRRSSRRLQAAHEIAEAAVVPRSASNPPPACSAHQSAVLDSSGTSQEPRKSSRHKNAEWCAQTGPASAAPAKPALSPQQPQPPHAAAGESPALRRSARTRERQAGSLPRHGKTGPVPASPPAPAAPPKVVARPRPPALQHDPTSCAEPEEGELPQREPEMDASSSDKPALAAAPAVPHAAPSATSRLLALASTEDWTTASLLGQKSIITRSHLRGPAGQERLGATGENGSQGQDWAAVVDNAAAAADAFSVSKGQAQKDRQAVRARIQTYGSAPNGEDRRAEEAQGEGGKAAEEEEEREVGLAAELKKFAKRASRARHHQAKVGGDKKRQSQRHAGRAADRTHARRGGARGPGGGTGNGPRRTAPLPKKRRWEDREDGSIGWTDNGRRRPAPGAGPTNVYASNPLLEEEQAGG